MSRHLLTYFFLFCGSVFFAQRNLLPDTIGFCAGDSASIEIKHHFDNSTNITWYTPQGIITSTKKVKVLRPGRYLLKISSSKINPPILDSSFVRLYTRPVSDLRDTTMCKGRPITMDAGNQGMAYLWSTGETTQKIKIPLAGRYWVKVTNGNCSVKDSFSVKQVLGMNVQLNPEMEFCLNEENKVLSIKVSAGTKIMWNTGATSPAISVNKEGTYWVRTETRKCGVQADTVKVKLKACDCEMMIPNGFSPNEDGKNDYFYPMMQCDYTYFTMTISDRWGNTVYSSNNLNGKWDGRFKGNLCPEDIYIYRIESTERSGDKKQVRTGHVSLFR